LKKAFTLIEMLVVLVFVGLLLAVGVPSIVGNFRAVSLSAGVRLVASELSLARQMAITQRKPVTVSFLTNNASFLIFTNTVQIGKTEFLPVSVEYGNNPAAIVFQPAGGLAVIQGAKVVLRNKAGEAGTISVNGLTGYVKVDR